MIPRLYLVGEQTTPNLRPILALKPRTVGQSRRRPNKLKKAAGNLENMASAMSKTLLPHDWNPKFIDGSMDEDSPSGECRKTKVGEALSLGPGAVVNLADGSKPRSIGASLAAGDQAKPMLSGDPAARRFRTVGKCPLLKRPPFAQIAASLTVEEVMAEHDTPPNPRQSDLANAKGGHRAPFPAVK